MKQSRTLQAVVQNVSGCFCVGCCSAALVHSCTVALAPGVQRKQQFDSHLHINLHYHNTTIVQRVTTVLSTVLCSSVHEQAASVSQASLNQLQCGSSSPLARATHDASGKYLGWMKTFEGQTQRSHWKRASVILSLHLSCCLSRSDWSGSHYAHMSQKSRCWSTSCLQHWHPVLF